MRDAKQVSILVLAAFILILGGCSRGEKDNAVPVPVAKPKVAVLDAKTKSIQPGFQVPGTIVARQTARVKPEIAALIKDIHITPGSLVKKGDLLVEMEESNLQAKLDAAEAALSSAKASAQQAKVNFDRAEKLKPQGYISGQDYDKLVAEVANTDAAVQQAEAKLERAQLDMDRTKIYAPFDGKISESFHAVGDNVGPLATKPLFELVELSPIYAVGDVEQTRYEDFVLKRMEYEQQGKPIPELVVGLKLPSGKEYPLKGTFENWDPSAAAQSGTIKGRVLFDNPNQLLLPGENVTIFGRLQEAIERITIPQKAVSLDQQGHYVMVIGDDGKVARANVEVGIRDGADWAITSGLKEGDKIIVEGLQKVKPGIEVEAMPYQPPEANPVK